MTIQWHNGNDLALRNNVSLFDNPECFHLSSYVHAGCMRVWFDLALCVVAI